MMYPSSGPPSGPIAFRAQKLEGQHPVRIDEPHSDRKMSARSTENKIFTTPVDTNVFSNTAARANRTRLSIGSPPIKRGRAVASMPPTNSNRRTPQRYPNTPTRGMNGSVISTPGRTRTPLRTSINDELMRLIQKEMERLKIELEDAQAIAEHLRSSRQDDLNEVREQGEELVRRVEADAKKEIARLKSEAEAGFRSLRDRSDMEIEEIRNEHDAELDKVKDDKRALVQEIQALKFAIEKGIDDHAGWPSPVKRAHNEMQKKLHVVEEDFANFRRSRQQDDELYREQIDQIKKDADIEVQRMRTTCDTLEEQLVRITQERDNARSEGRRLHERCEMLEKRQGESAGLMEVRGLMNDAAEKELRAAQSKIIDLEQALRQKDVQIDNHHRRLQVVEGSQGGGKMGWWTAFREKGLFEEFSQAEFEFLREMLLVGAPRSAQSRRYQN